MELDTHMSPRIASTSERRALELSTISHYPEIRTSNRGIRADRSGTVAPGTSKRPCSSEALQNKQLSNGG